MLPYSTKILQYNLYPLLAGSVALPRLSLSIPENSTEGPALRQDQLNQLIERTIPYNMYVMVSALLLFNGLGKQLCMTFQPQLKGNPKLPNIVQLKNVTVS